MGIGGVAAGIGAAASVASAANSIANSGGSGGGGANGSYGGNPGTYIPQAQPAADQYYQGLLGNLNSNTGYLTGIQPGLQYDFSQFYQNNPYSMGAQAGANNAAGYGLGTLAPMQQAGAAGLQNLGNQIAPYGATILNNAFDPQTDLYNRTAQNVLGQSAVANAQAGVQGPAAAGVTDSNINKFNIDWQNNQLSRGLSGLQGYGSVLQSAGRGYAGASDLGTGAESTMLASAGLPYGTNLSQLGDIFSQYSNLANSTTTSFSPEFNALQSYLQLGQSASGLAQAGQHAGFNQGQVLGNTLGSGLASLANNQGLANLFGGGGAGSGSYDPYSSSLPSFLGGYGSYGGFNDLSSANDVAGFAGGFG